MCIYTLIIVWKHIDLLLVYDGEHELLERFIAASSDFLVHVDEPLQFWQWLYYSAASFSCGEVLRNGLGLFEQTLSREPFNDCDTRITDFLVLQNWRFYSHFCVLIYDGNDR